MPIIRTKFRDEIDKLHFKLEDALEDLRQPMSEKALQAPPLDSVHNGQYILMPPTYADKDALVAPPGIFVEEKSNLKYTLCTPTLQTELITNENFPPKPKGRLEAAPHGEPGEYILMPPSYADPDSLKAPPAKGIPVRFSQCKPTAQAALDPYAYPYYPWEFQKKTSLERRQLNDLLRWNGPGPMEEEDDTPSAEDVERMERTVHQAQTTTTIPPQRRWLVRTIWT